MDDAPILESGLLGLDVKETASWLAGCRASKTHRFTLSSECPLDGVEGASRNRLGLVQNIEKGVRVNSFNEGGNIARHCKGAAEAQIQIELQQLVAIKWGSADHVPT